MIEIQQKHPLQYLQRLDIHQIANRSHAFDLCDNIVICSDAIVLITQRANPNVSSQNNQKTLDEHEK